MDLTSLKAHIKTGKFNRWYVFTGPEVKVMDIYIQQMAKSKNATVQRLDEVSNLVAKSRSRSFVSQAHIYVLRDSKDFISDDNIKSFIEQTKTFTDDIIIFIYSNIDKRSKLYKSYQDRIVEFAPLKMPVLLKYIQKDIDLGEKYATMLAEICEMDYSRILLEIDKIKCYQKASESNVGGCRERIETNQCMKNLLNDGTIYKPPYDAVFDFVDAVLKYKPKLAFKLLGESYASGEATMVLLSNLYNSTKQLLQVQSYNGDDLIKSTGLTPFQVKLAKGRMNIYKNGDLVYFMRVLRSVEKGIKTGEIEEDMAVQYALVCLWS